jgi:hypothetical protein
LRRSEERREVWFIVGKLHKLLGRRSFAHEEDLHRDRPCRATARRSPYNICTPPIQNYLYLVVIPCTYIFMSLVWNRMGVSRQSMDDGTAQVSESLTQNQTSPERRRRLPRCDAIRDHIKSCQSLSPVAHRRFGCAPRLSIDFVCRIARNYSRMSLQCTEYLYVLLINEISLLVDPHLSRRLWLLETEDHLIGSLAC